MLQKTDEGEPCSKKVHNYSLFYIFVAAGPYDILFLVSTQYEGKIAPRARFSKVPETFRARKAIFNLSVCINWDVYTPETSCMKGM